MSFFSKKRIFLDQAGGQNNPAAIYSEGRKAKKELEDARTKIARLLRAGVKDVIFTSGGTESDNLAVLGVFEYALTLGVNKPHIIISDIEHPAVLESAREAERRGAALSVICANEESLVDPVEVMKLVTENTVLISVSLVHGVTGAVQPIHKITRLVREYRKKENKQFPYVHTDASQAPLMLDVSVDSLGVDMMTLDAGKFYGPKCGVLVVRPSVGLQAVVFGGRQERGLRAGTQDVASAVGFAEAFEKVIRQREETPARIKKLRSYFIAELARYIPEAMIHGPKDPQKVAAHIVAVSVPGILSEFLAVALDEKGIAVSAGSACSSDGDTDDSQLLRFSFGAAVSQAELLVAVKNFSEIVSRAKMGT